MRLQLTTTAFVEGQPIPSRHALDQEDISPDLQWSGVPPMAKSLALICDDPDAPGGTWVHWVAYNIPATLAGLAEDVPKSPLLVSGVMQGTNDYKTIGYGGPCPPPGNPHRYCFKLYALNYQPHLKPALKKQDLLNVMEGHILAEGQLMGTYQRK